ncbi:hypothetical protein Nepgr_015090 [Nepenthes gracilis]|uniref:Uncharacterized protein n=1 Tax=Nepenthes gracilis TaxID=150966 RepID=A0AAD3SMA2_NEPGR|nr:hypothetical protein Nepgr_015090 [Nepenthes gracilis]
MGGQRDGERELNRAIVTVVTVAGRKHLHQNNLPRRLRQPPGCLPDRSHISREANALHERPSMQKSGQHHRIRFQDCRAEQSRRHRQLPRLLHQHYHRLCVSGP